MNPDDDIRIVLSVQVPVMGNVTGGRCAWTAKAELPTVVRRVDPGEIVRRETGSARGGGAVFLYRGRAYTDEFRGERWATAEGLAEAVAILAKSGMHGVGACVDDDHCLPPAKRTGRNAVHREYRAEALESLSRERDLLIHDGTGRIYRAWRRGPLFPIGPGVFEPRSDRWELGYSPGRSEDHFRWGQAVCDSPARNATESVAQAERDCPADLLAAMPPDSDVLNFMETAPIELFAAWKPLAPTRLDELGLRLRDLAGLGLAKALDEGRRYEDLRIIQAAAGALLQGRRAPVTRTNIEFILAWCEAVAMPRVLAEPVPADDAEAISGLAP